MQNDPNYGVSLCPEQDTQTQAKALRPAFKLIVLGFVGLSFIMVLVTLVRRDVDVLFHNGNSAHIRVPSLFTQFLGSDCEITYSQRDIGKGTVVLRHTLFESPIIVASANDPKVFLCLYEFDVDLRLVKIDTKGPLRPFPQGSPLQTIVGASPWKVEEGNVDDWKSILTMLEETSLDNFRRQSVPTLDLGMVRLYARPEALVQRIRAQMKVMYRSTGLNQSYPTSHT